MLASMSEIGWNHPDMDADMSELPTGTVTLLLADVEGSTRLWETQPEAMQAAVGRLDRTLSDAVATHGGVRPVEQGEGDSFVIAFPRAADGVACALELQRAPLAPIKLRIGVHTGDVQLRDEGNYIGPTINRTARLRDLAHGGQTVLSGATEPLVIDQLPPDVSLIDLGTHPLRDLPRPERVVQLCHPDLHNEFPALRTVNTLATEHLPTQLTSFIGRRREMTGIRDALADNRLVTLTGAGGAGKTRLAVQIAANAATDYPDGVWYVDLAPITHPDVVPVTVARALGLPDQPGQPTMDVLLRFIRDRQMLMLVDNCEHLLDASAAMITGLLGACPALTLLTTSREPIGVAGEVSWRVPSLSLADEAIELFSDRARRTKPEFRVTADNANTVTEICRRLDGLPLAIELAAARVRALSLTEIRDSLHDTFRLLTGGARTSVRRQQTLRASVDWSHALLSEPEQVLFRRLAVFFGGFDVDAAQSVAGSGDVERYQVLDQLTLLVDKSLVVADDNPHSTTRYRLLETVRQYAQEKLGESREGDAVRVRHRDHYTAVAALVDTPTADHERRIEWAETEMDNLRGAFAWSLENSDAELALELASSLQPLWLTRGRIQEGLAWLGTALADEGTQSPGLSSARVRAAANRALLLSFLGTNENNDEIERIVVMARERGDESLLALALTACGMCSAYDTEAARQHFAEAAGIARGLGDLRALGQIRAQEALAAFIGDGPVAEVRAAAEEGLRIADGIGDGFVSRQCRFALGWAQMFSSDLPGAAVQFGQLLDETVSARDAMFSMYALVMQAYALSYAGDVAGALAAAEAAMHHASELFDYYEGPVYTALAHAHLAAGDATAAWEAYQAALRCSGMDLRIASTYDWAALAALACGDLTVARRLADDVVSVTKGCGLSLTLTSRAYVEIAQGEPDAAARDASDALDLAARLGSDLTVPFALDCLAMVAGDADNHLTATRLFGAAEAARSRMGMARIKVLDAATEARVAALRDAMGEADFDAAWGEGAALTLAEAIAYAQRGRGARNRPSSGWASLTPAELDVVGLVCEGLGNKDIAARLFVSPRTVQAHLTHVYNKLGLTSRVQLAQEMAARTQLAQETSRHAAGDAS
jgi:predicted ATPase/class 3 adenylate cyclase/DNA-binding CsgD family transcriptional regulator